MSRNVMNFLIDLVTALVMVAMLATGLMIRFALPPGSGSRRILWGYGRHDWGDVHFWLAIASLGIVLVHVALHWQWVCAMFSRMIPGGAKAEASSARRSAIGISAIVAVVALSFGFVKLARQSVRESGSTIAERGNGGEHRQEAARTGEPRHDSGEESGGQSIRGSMTLAEVAQACGITVENVRSRLKLAADEPADERLGRLSKKYGFSMQDVRDKLDTKPAPNS